MAGGTWTTQNKVRPGVYINFESQGQSLGTASERGVVGLALSLPWGPAKTLLQVNSGDDVQGILGYDLTSASLLLVKEALKRARTLLLYRLNSGTAATVTAGNLIATARYGGERGNDLSIVIRTNVDQPDKYDVITLLSGVVKDTQVVGEVEELVNNDWVVWSGSGELATSAGIPLTSGANGTVVNVDHTDFMSALELQDFHTVAYTGTDETLKGLYAAFIRRQREQEGKKVQAVLSNYPTADYEGVISVKNGVVLSDGTVLTAAQATAWVAAATAAATVSQGLTYASYDDATDASPRYTNSQTETALTAGEFMFTASGGRAYVEQDINTLTSVTPAKPRSFRKNRVIRVLDIIANDFKRIFESSYLGKVNNNEDGRSLFRSEVVVYLQNLQQINAIQNFDTQADVTVSAGPDSDSIYVEANIQPVDSIEKIYIRVNVR